MTKDQAAKLAQAYQWLSEGKNVDYYTGQNWLPWYGWHVESHAYRTSPSRCVSAGRTCMKMATSSPTPAPRKRAGTPMMARSASPSPCAKCPRRSSSYDHQNDVL